MKSRLSFFTRLTLWRHERKQHRKYEPRRYLNWWWL